MPTSPPVHLSQGVISEAARKRLYDAARPPRSAIYGHRWRKLRAAYLASHPTCECGCGYPATVVDHRQPHLGDPALIYAWDNLSAMTKACHDRKTAARDGGFGNPVRSRA